MTVEEIGSIIRTERIRKGLSCRELAELSNTSAATVCRLETGKRKGSTKAALKIFKALGIKLEITEEKTTESIVDSDGLYSTVVTGQEIIDFIHNCKLEDTPITRTCDELIFSKRLDTGYGTYEETSLHLNLQSGMYYKDSYQRKIYEYKKGE